jgi:aspartate/methionine/tyrosine aminotransferase
MDDPRPAAQHRSPDFPLARRAAEIRPFHVMELLARAKQLESEGRDVVHMEIGEPDFRTPEPVCEAGIRAIREGHHFYTPSCGLPALREAIAGFYRTRYGVTIAPERIIVTSGSSGALMLAMALLVNPGDRVLMADPGYPCNRNFVRAMGGEALEVPVGAETGFQLTNALVSAHWRERIVGVLLASPSNPTGTLVPPTELAAIARTAAERNAALLVDEIYHGLVYEGEAPTVVQFSDEAFVINSFSKYFNMTGWRLGWMVAPQRYLREIDKLSQNIYLSAPAASQHAALAALKPEALAIYEERREEFRRRRDFLVPALRKLGFDIPVTPQGAFYIYAGCDKLTADSFTFCRDLLEQAGVAITPGADFGNHHPERYVRFAYTCAVPRLAEGVARIAGFLER